MEPKDLLKLLDRALSEYINLEERVEKAIEYIEDRYDGEAITHTFDKDNIKELLEMLKGDE